MCAESMATACGVGLQPYAVSAAGADMSAVFAVLVSAQCTGMAVVPPPVLSAETHYRLGQNSCMGHCSHRGERAEQMSRPNSTKR